MKLISINKYLLKIIFSHIKISKHLNIIKFSKKYQSKLDLTINDYQKSFFNSIISPTLLINTEILLKNKILDKKTLDKLLLDWNQDNTEIIKDKQYFHANEKYTKKNNPKNIKILNLSSSNQKIINNVMPNLIELNLSEIKYLELPCSILAQLETLSLINIYKIKFIKNKSNNDSISMNNLKHLYLDNISFEKDNNIKINITNLKYLDLRLKEQDGFDEDPYFDNDNNKAGFYKENTIENLINIFNFKFLSAFPIDTSKYISELEDYEVDDDPFIEDKYSDLSEIFKNKGEELFLNNKVLLSKYDYFNLEILHEYFRISGSAEFAERFIYEYKYSKTKGNKYLFNIKYDDYQNCNGDYFEMINEETKYCNSNNFNDYYFYDNKVNLKEDSLYLNNINNPEKVKSLFLTNKVDFLNEFKNDNSLEILSIENLDLNNKNFLKNLKKFKNLKCFCVKNNCLFNNNKQILDLIKALSNFKFLFLVEINIEGKIKLSNDDINKIKKIFNDVSFDNKKNKNIIYWCNNNLKLNDLRNTNN